MAALRVRALRALTSFEKHYEYLHAALEEWYEGLQGGREGGVEYVLSLHVGLAHCPRVQAEQRAVPSHLEQGKSNKNFRAKYFLQISYLQC